MSIGIGIGLSPIITSSKGVMEPEAIAYFRRASPPIPAEKRASINDLVKSLKDAGVMQRLDGLYIGLDAAGNHASLNLAQAAYDYTINGTTVLDTDGAYKSQSNSYIRTGWRFADAGARGRRDDFHIGLFSDTDVASDNNDAFCGGGAGFISVQCRRVGNYINARINDSSPVGALATAMLSGLGHFTAVRPSSASRQIYRNGLLVSADSGASSGVPSEEIVFLSRAGTNWSSRRFFALHWGLSLTAEQVSAMNTALVTYFETILIEVPADE